VTVFRHGADWIAVEALSSWWGLRTGLRTSALRSFRGCSGVSLSPQVGTHQDWDEFDRVMAAEGRTAVFVTPERISGNS